MPTALRAWLVSATLLAGTVASAEEAVRRELVDAGVHQPVMTRPPELLQFVPAPYPPEAEKAGKTAAVHMQVTLGADGVVTDAKVPQPTGDGFDEAAIDAVKKFKFRAAEVDGVPASIQFEYVYNFTLAAPVKPPEPPPPPPEAIVKGLLHQRGSRSMVAFAIVRCGDDPESPQAVSDVRGRFELHAPPGPCRLRVLTPTFEPYSARLELKPQETTQLELYLEPKQGGFETVVKAEKDSKEVSKYTIGIDEATKVPGTFGDPIRVIQNLPGVARSPYLLGQLIVRGANPAQTLTFLDGVEIPLLFHLLGGPSVINAQFLDHIDFYPGGFGARYGRAVGGVVDVETRKGAADTFHGEVKADVLDASVYASTPIVNGVSVSAAARRSYVDALIPLILPAVTGGSAGTLLILPVYWDYQLRIDVGGPPKDLLVGGNYGSVFAFGSDDQLAVVASGAGRSRDVSASVHTLFHRIKGNWTFQKGNFTSSFSPYIGYDLAALTFGSTSLKGNQYDLGGRQDFTLKFNRNFTLHTGLDLYYEHTIGHVNAPILGGTQYVAFPGSSNTPETQSLSETLNGFDGAAYAEMDFLFGNFLITPGVRASYIQELGQKRYALDPRLWINWKVAPKAIIKASAGLYSQRPDLTDLLQAPFGNPNLGPERAFQSSIGVIYKFTDAISLDVTGFFNRRYDNIVAPGPTIVNANGSVTNYALSNNGLGRAYGLEVLLKHEVTSRFFGWISYTLSRSLIRTAGDPTSDYVLSPYDQTHILSAIGSYKLPWWGLELGARFRFVTGTPTTPVIHPYDIYNGDTNRFGSTNGPTNSSRLKNFQQLDMRLEKSFLFKSWTLAVYVDVQNVYNYQNSEAITYDYRFRQSFQVPGIPILPVIGARANW